MGPNDFALSLPHHVNARMSWKLLEKPFAQPLHQRLFGRKKKLMARRPDGANTPDANRDPFFVRDWAISFQTQPVTQSNPPLNPPKRLMSQWTARETRDKEKHFPVARVIHPEAPRHQIQEVEMEAVMTQRRFILRWQALTGTNKRAQGGV